MPQQEPREKRKLTVLSYKEIHRGTGKNGPWVMYEVEALTEAGQRIGPQTGQALRAFQELPINELVEYEVEVRDTERHGRTFTLFPPKVPVWKQVAELRERVDRLEQLVEQLAKGQKPGLESRDTASDVPPEELPAAEPPPVQTW